MNYKFYFKKLLTQPRAGSTISKFFVKIVGLPINQMGIAFFTGMFWAYFTVFGIPQTIKIVEDWQTLISALIALGAAVAGVKAVLMINEVDRARKIRDEMYERSRYAAEPVNKVAYACVTIKTLIDMDKTIEGEFIEGEFAEAVTAEDRQILHDHIGYGIYSAVIRLEQLIARYDLELTADYPKRDNTKNALIELTDQLSQWASEQRFSGAFLDYFFIQDRQKTMLKFAEEETAKGRPKYLP